MPVDCVLMVDGVRYADTGPGLIAGTPTVLAELEVTWGRETTVDQPSPATCTFVVWDRPGGAGFLTAGLDVGSTVAVVATGDIATGTPANIAVDPGFETLPVGPVTARVAVQTGQAAAVATPTHNGARAVSYDPPTPSWMLIPPAAFHATDPTVWDGIARFDPARPWTWSLAVRADRFQSVTVTPVHVAGPTFPTPGAAAGPPSTVVGAGTWVVASGTTDVATGANDWLGLRVDVGNLPPWTAVPETWATVPGTWLDYRGVIVDDVALNVPAGQQLRPALVFSGRVTDFSAQLADDGTVQVEVTAVDQLAELENRAVGGVPWPAESLTARVAHIVGATGLTIPARIDPPLGTATVTWVDVDNQPAAGLLADHAQGVDGVLWSATHQTTGPYLWFENPQRRAQLGELVLDEGLVVIVWTDTSRGATSLDGCLLPVEPITWVRDVSDVITRVDATWSEQTLGSDGVTPDPTDRTVTVDGDPAAITKHGIRRYAVTTLLTTSAAASDVAARILARSTSLEWRIHGLSLDVGLTPPDAGPQTAGVLDLLDGTTRLGRGLIVDDADLWPAGPLIGLYLEGGTYRYDGAWRLALNASSHTGMGASVRWNQMDATWAWNEMDPTIRWFDLWGVAP